MLYYSHRTVARESSTVRTFTLCSCCTLPLVTIWAKLTLWWSTMRARSFTTIPKVRADTAKIDSYLLCIAFQEMEVWVTGHRLVGSRTTQTLEDFLLKVVRLRQAARRISLPSRMRASIFSSTVRRPGS